MATVAAGPDPSGNRLTALTDDNHQPWLWFVEIFSCFCVVGAGGLRFWIRRKNYGSSDIVLAVAYVFYIPYWILLLFALINHLGETDQLAGPLHEVKASKLVFASRILLVFIVNAAKLATLFLVREIFTEKATRMWFYIIVVLTAVETFIGSVMISASCSPGRIILSGENAHCPGNSARWIVLTIFETSLELLLVVPVAMIVLTLQTNLKNKLFTISAFLCRLMIWIPAILHLVFYTSFIRHGQNNIGIVPTIAMEQLWVSLALISASVPALLRIAKRFTTSGVTVGTVSGSSGKAYGSRFRTTGVNNSHQMASMNKSQATANTSKIDPRDDDGMVLRPDQGYYTVSIDAKKRGIEDGSMNSTEGILRQVDYDVSYETKEPPHI